MSEGGESGGIDKSQALLLSQGLEAILEEARSGSEYAAAAVRSITRQIEECCHALGIELHI